jgi:hypothetical protein
MYERGESGLAIRTALAADLPALQQVYRAASLSNAGDAPLLLARPEFLVFTGDGIAAGRTLVAVAGPSGNDRVVGFATVASGPDGRPCWNAHERAVGGGSGRCLQRGSRLASMSVRVEWAR